MGWSKTSHVLSCSIFCLLGPLILKSEGSDGCCGEGRPLVDQVATYKGTKFLLFRGAGSSEWLGRAGIVVDVEVRVLPYFL
jgi:hypothetical protein